MVTVYLFLIAKYCIKQRNKVDCHQMASSTWIRIRWSWCNTADGECVKTILVVLVSPTQSPANINVSFPKLIHLCRDMLIKPLWCWLIGCWHNAVTGCQEAASTRREMGHNHMDVDSMSIDREGLRKRKGAEIAKCFIVSLLPNRHCSI